MFHLAACGAVGMIVATADLGREWTDRSGKFSVDAEYVAYDQGAVKLKKADGSMILVPVGQLSDVDVEFVLAQIPRNIADYVRESKKSRAAYLGRLSSRVESLKPYLAMAKRGRVVTDPGEFQRLVVQSKLQRKSRRTAKMISDVGFSPAGGSHSILMMERNIIYRTQQAKQKDIEYRTRQLESTQKILATPEKSPRSSAWYGTIELPSPPGGQERVIGAPRQRLQLGDLKEGTLGKFYPGTEVVNIIDGDTMVMKLVHPRLDELVWVEGHPTAEFQEHGRHTLPGIFEIRGWKEIRPAIDGKSRAILIEPVDLSEYEIFFRL
jgi:hypothetical protein